MQTSDGNQPDRLIMKMSPQVLDRITASFDFLFSRLALARNGSLPLQRCVFISTESLQGINWLLVFWVDKLVVLREDVRKETSSVHPTLAAAHRRVSFLHLGLSANRFQHKNTPSMANDAAGFPAFSVLCEALGGRWRAGRTARLRVHKQKDKRGGDKTTGQNEKQKKNKKKGGSALVLN